MRQSTWFAGLPQDPTRSSAALGWRRLEAHRYDRLRCSGFALPPAEGHFIAAHLLRPCKVETRWGGHFHRGGSLPGNFMIMSAGQDSVWNCSAAIDELHIFLDPGVVNEVAGEIGLPAFRLIDGVGLTDPTLGELTRQILTEIENPGVGTGLFADMMARTLALHLLRRHSTAGAHRFADRIEITPHQLRQSTDYIESHLGEDLTLERIAEAAAMSPFRFARAFRKSMGQSPRQYVIIRRIERAKEMLRGSDRDLSDIANGIGFATQSHFTAVFHKRCGTTPKKYRDLCRV